jgi:peroxiredoxin
MKESQNYDTLPKSLVKSLDDEVASHLAGKLLPSILLPSTNRQTVDLSARSGRTVVYCYPLTARPDQNVIPKGWDEIPGARGCTPQSCAFRDYYTELKSLNADVYGLSVQTTDYQLEVKERLHLPFDLLSDAELAFATTLNLPTFEVNEQTFIKRITLILKNGLIEKVFYPVFLPNQNANEVIEWLMQHP